MEIKVRKVDEVTILDIGGNIKESKDLEAFTNAVSSVLDDGSTKILLNFEKVRFITSSGLGRIVMAIKKISGIGGQLKVMNLGKEIDELFTYTRLKDKISVLGSEEEAVKSF